MVDVIEKEAPARQAKAKGAPPVTVRLRADDLRDALPLLASAMDRRNTIPVLDMVLVRPDGGMAELVTTDLDQMMVVQVPGEYANGNRAPMLISDPRPVSVAARLLGEGAVTLTRTVRQVPVHGPRGQVIGDSDKSVITARTGTLERTSEHDKPVEEFPLFKLHGACLWQASVGAEFISALREVAGAVSTEETRYYLNGVVIEARGGWTFRLVATDGHRINYRDVQIPGATGEIVGRAIIPNRFVKAMLLHGARGDEPLTVEMWGVAGSVAAEADKKHGKKTGQADATGIRVTRGMARRRGDNAVLGRWSLTGKLIDGTYPDYTRVIPTNRDYRVTINPVDLIQAVRALTAGDGKRPPAVKLMFGVMANADGEGDPKPCAKLSIRHDDSGSSALTIPVKGHDVPDDQHIGFNGRYLIDAMAVFAGAGDVVLSLGEGNKCATSSAPVKIEAVSGAGSIVVLMPLRV